MALLMVMTVCLMVYAALEYRLREALTKNDQTIPDQMGRPDKRPTMRWVFQLFTGIHVLHIPDRASLILNLKSHHKNIVQILGATYQRLYT